MTNLFESAKPVTSNVKGKKTGDKFIPIEGLEAYCAVTTAIKALKAEEEVQRIAIDEQFDDYFATEGEQHKQRPENFKGMEGDTRASCELRRRTITSILKDPEIDKLNELKIPYETIPDTFVLNPEHTDWIKKNAEKISVTLTKLGAPSDLIQIKVGKRIVSDESIAAVFKLSREQILELLPIVSTYSIKKTGETSLTSAWELIKTLFQTPTKAKKKKEPTT